jgi:hypothetical protein
MTRYRNPSSGEVWEEDDLIASLTVEIAASMDEESCLRQDIELRGNEAIRDYIIECCLVGIYEMVDDEWP